MTDHRPIVSGDDAFITDELAAKLMPRRFFGAHKWDVGGVVIVGGAPHYFGAVALSAQAAGRAGAGIVSLAVPRSLVGVLATLVPEATFVPLSETESFSGAKSAAGLIVDKLHKAKALLLGPGLGDDEAAAGLMSALFQASSPSARLGFGVGFGMGRQSGSAQGSAVSEESHATPIVSADRPMVLDADALNWFATRPDWTNLIPRGRAVITPHPGELSRLLDRPVDELLADPVAAAKAAAADWGQVVVFKYGHTVVTDGARALIADQAPTSLATAGTGDVLAGTIAAFLAQGVKPLDAAALAVWAGTRAATQCEREVGTLGLLASDLPLEIARALRTLEQGDLVNGG